MRTLLWLMLAAASLGAQTVAEIENLEKSWVKAVVARDFAALDRMISPEIVYGHASGVVDTKAQWLDKQRSGRQVYKSLEQRGIVVKLHGNTAVTHCFARVTGVNPQGPFDDKIMMLHVWVQRGGAWQLAAHQTARVDKLP